jgi:hypothetical protein
MQLMNDDNKMLKKILQGNYLAKREVQNKLSKDNKLQERVSNCFLCSDIFILKK